MALPTKISKSRSIGETGIFDLTNSQYHNSDGISKSSLDLVHVSPRHYQYKKENPGSDKQTPSMQLGTMVHLAVLEPKDLVQYFDQWEIKQKVKDEVFKIRDSVLNNKLAKSLLDKTGRAELSMFWSDPITNLVCKCRPDYITKDYILDLKTTRSALPYNFTKSIAQYRYHVQAGWYLDGVNTCLQSDIKDFYFIAVETSAPYEVIVCKLDEYSVNTGRNIARRDINKLADCIRDNVYPGFSDEILEFTLPQWARDENLDFNPIDDQ